jgi:hypothetical protein
MANCTGCDTAGRKYLTFADAKPGLRIQVDGGFTCIGDGEFRELKADTQGDLYFECNGPEGECEPGPHILDGQEADEGEWYVGVYPAEPA